MLVRIPGVARIGAWAAGTCIAAGAAGQVTVGDAFLLEQEITHHASQRDQEAGALCAGPGEYFAVFIDSRLDGAGRDLYAQRIGLDGAIKAPGSLELLIDETDLVAGSPAVAWNGSVYLVVWYERSPDELRGLRVDAEGKVLDPGGFTIDSQAMEWWPAMASDGRDFLVTYSTLAGVVSAKRIGGDGTVLDPAPLELSAGATELGYPKVAWGDGYYAVVWTQRPNQAIWGCRVSSAGDVLDPGGENISGGGADIDPHITFDGERFFVVWQRRRDLVVDIFGAHVTTEGFSASPARLLLDGSWGPVTNSQMAWNGSHHLITLTTPEPVFGTDNDLYAMRVDASGFPEGGPFEVCTIPGSSSWSFGVAALGGQWFTLWWRSWLQSPFYISDVEGARVDGDGVVLDPTAAAVAVSTSASGQFGSAADFDGENFLVVFEDRRDPPTPWPGGGPAAAAHPPIAYVPDLYAVRITPEGTPVDAAALPIARSLGRTQEAPDVAFGGGMYGVVYENEGPEHEDEVRLKRVLPDGTAPDPDGILIYRNDSAFGYLRLPRITSSDDAWCVIWVDDSLVPGEKPVQYAVVGHDGALRAGPASLPSDGAWPGSHEVVSDGSGFVVTYMTSEDRTWSAHIDASGAMTGARIIHSRGVAPKLAWTGDGYIAAWTESVGSPTFLRTAHSLTLAPDGTPTGPALTLREALPSGASVQAMFARGGEIVAVMTPYSLCWLNSAGELIRGPESFSLPAPVRGFSTHLGWAMDPGGGVLATMSAWAGNPYNADRVYGRVITFDEPCFADCDGTGGLDFFDFLCFQDQFAAGDPEADCDGTGALDFFDFLCFQNAFAAACA